MPDNETACCNPNVYEDGFSHEFGFQAELVVEDACSDACHEKAVEAWRGRSTKNGDLS